MKLGVKNEIEKTIGGVFQPRILSLRAEGSAIPSAGSGFTTRTIEKTIGGVFQPRILSLRVLAKQSPLSGSNSHLTLRMSIQHLIILGSCKIGRCP